MPIAIGNNSFVGVGEEAIYGTAVARTRFLLQNSESIAPTERFIESGSVFRRGRHALRHTQGLVEVGGDITFNPQYSSQAHMIFLKHKLGSISSSQPDVTGAPTVYRHTFTPAVALPTGLSIEVGKDVLAHLHAGCKVISLSWRFTPGEMCECTVGVICRETTSIDDSAIVYTEGKLMVSTNTTVTWNAVAKSCRDFTLTINNPLERRNFINSRFTSEPQRSGKTRVSGTFTIELEDAVLYSDFRNMTSRELILTATGDAIAGGYSFEFKATMSVAKIISGIAQANTEGVLTIPYAFEAFLDDSNANELSIRITNEASGV